MNIVIVSAVLRHLLTAVGGIAVARGYLDSGTLETTVGAVLTIVGVAWSIWDKRGRAA